MDIIEELLVEIATEVAADATMVAVAKGVRGAASRVAHAKDAKTNPVDDDIENQGGLTFPKPIGKTPCDCHFYIKLITSNKKPGFVVTDLDGQTIFFTKGRLSRNAVDLKVKSNNGQTVGRIKKRLLAIRNPRKHEPNPADFSVYLGDSLFASVKTNQAPVSGYTIKPQGWSVRSGTSGFVAYEGDRALFYLDDLRWYSSGSFMISCCGGMDERSALLLSLVITAHIVSGDLVVG